MLALLPDIGVSENTNEVGEHVHTAGFPGPSVYEMPRTLLPG